MRHEPAVPAVTISKADRERLLMEQLPQVRFIARKIHDRLPHHVDMEDLVSAGVIGLIDAMKKYDAGKNVQFKSYAQFRIRGAILDSLRELDWSPRDLRKKARGIDETRQKLAGELGRAPSEQEIARELGIGLHEYQLLLGQIRGLDIGSLHIEFGEDSRNEDFANQIAADPAENPFQLCAQSEMREILAEAIGQLPEKERQVLALYYFEELTMKEIGTVLGVVESRVSQIHTAALVRLRGLMNGAPSPPPRAASKETARASKSPARPRR